MTTLFDQLRHALGEYTAPPVPNPAEAVARCPTCDSWHDTLHLEDRPDGTVALWCDNHCPTAEILEDLGVDPGSVGVTGPSTAAEALAETHAALVDQLAADEYRRLEARDLARRRWDANQAADTPAAPSWAAVDLADYLDGSHTPPTPTLMRRSDGHGLLYRGLVHSMHGESESGKSLVAQIEAVRILADGGRVLYLDFESDPGSVLERLQEFGATAEQIRAGFVYVRPEQAPTRPVDAAAFAHHLAEPFDLAVIDGVTDALGMWGAETRDNDGIARWSRDLPKRIADSTGAAVLLIDHVTKDSDGRGRFAIGGQAKLSTLTGAGYTVEVTQPLGRGLRGVVVLRVAKDRPGHIRGLCGPMRPSDRTQEAARVVVDSTGPTPTVTIEPPRVDDATGGRGFRPTSLMEKISRHLEQADDALSFNRINGEVAGREQYVRDALRVLVEEGFVTVTQGPRNATLHQVAQPYRQCEDPESDQFRPAGDGRPSSDCLTVSRPKTGRRETDSRPHPGDSRETVGDGQESHLPNLPEPPANLPHSATSERAEPPLPGNSCTVCGLPIPAAIRAEGSTTHPACDLQPAVTP